MAKTFVVKVGFVTPKIIAAALSCAVGKENWRPMR
jgi:hypothetical protein